MVGLILIGGIGYKVTSGKKVNPKEHSPMAQPMAQAYPGGAPMAQAYPGGAPVAMAVAYPGTAPPSPPSPSEPVVEKKDD